MITINNFATFIGTIGVIIVLIAYILLQLDKMSARSLSYSLLNLIGSLMILFSLYFEWNFPAVFIEIVWSLISCYGIFQRLKNQRKQ